ncbi:MAG: tetratricopeptide repeat protein [bacterium]
MAYDSAREKDTIPAYKEFLEKYPESEEADTARRRLWELEYQRARQDDTVKAYERYLSEYPDSKFYKAAEARLFELAYDKACEADTIEAYQQFLEKHPGSKYAEEVKDRMDTLRFQSAENKNTIDSYRSYLDKYPEGSHAEEARQRARRLVGCGILERAGNPEELSAYIKEHPDNRYSRWARDNRLAFDKLEQGPLAVEIQKVRLIRDIHDMGEFVKINYYNGSKRTWYNKLGKALSANAYPRTVSVPDRDAARQEGMDWILSFKYKESLGLRFSYGEVSGWNVYVNGNFVLYNFPGETGFNQEISVKIGPNDPPLTTGRLKKTLAPAREKFEEELPGRLPSLQEAKQELFVNLFMNRFPELKETCEAK